MLAGCLVRLPNSVFGKDGAAFVNKFGIFRQTTYDGVAKAWSWDNTEVRYADTGTLGGQSAIYGFYLNNNPTMQDPWNSTPAWGFPFTGSRLAPDPGCGHLDRRRCFPAGRRRRRLCHAGRQLLFRFGGYRTLGAHTQNNLGVDPSGETQITGLAPYWRVALEKLVGPGTWEIGTFGMAACTYPGRDPSAGKDRIVDIGIDTQYQESGGLHDVTVRISAGSTSTRTWNASQALWQREQCGGYAVELQGHHRLSLRQDLWRSGSVFRHRWRPAIPCCMRGA